MYMAKEDTVLLGVSELKSVFPSLLGHLREQRIVVTNRNRPCAVVLDYEEFKHLEALLDRAEEKIWAKKVKQRKRQKNKKSLTLAEAFKRVG